MGEALRILLVASWVVFILFCIFCWIRLGSLVIKKMHKEFGWFSSMFKNQDRDDLGMLVVLAFFWPLTILVILACKGIVLFGKSLYN